MNSNLAISVISAVLLAIRAEPLLNPYNFVQTGFASQPYSGFSAPGIIPAPQQSQNLAHPAVVENAIAESQLPQELLNPFYKNPAIAAGLAKESWFGDKEFPVHHREADKISRQQIFNIIQRLQHRRR